MSEFRPIKEELKLHMPIILEIIGSQPFSWPDKQLSAHLQSRENAFANNNRDLIIEVNFYDILAYSRAGNMRAKGMFEYLSQILERLCKTLNEHKTKLRPIIDKLLTNLDYKYLNFVGELSVLETLLSSGNYTLIKIEEPLGKGNISIDFSLNDIREAKNCLIEIVNFHVKSNHDDIGKWLNSKVNKKIEKTTKGDNDFLKFKLQPVIWGEHSELERVEKYFDDGNDVMHPNALIPYVLWIKHIQAGNIHFFCLNFKHITDLYKVEDCTFQKSYLL